MPASSSALSPVYLDAREMQRMQAHAAMNSVASLKFVMLADEMHGLTFTQRFPPGSWTPEWVVTRVTTRTLWESSGIRPDDVLVSVDGQALAHLERHEVAALLASGTILRARVNQPWNACHPARVSVVLSRSRLGVRLAEDGRDSIPIVYSLTLQPSMELRCGDILLAINHTSTVGLSLDRIAIVLQRAGRPARLTFQRWTHDACSSICREFRVYRDHFLQPRAAPAIECERDIEIIWREGRLGVTLIEDAVSGLPMVNRLTGKGTTRGLENLQHGSLLLAINGVEVAAQSVAEVYQALLATAKPLRLLFTPPRRDYEAVTRHDACSPVSTSFSYFNDRAIAT